MRIFISAGEPSGDLHGANFMRAVQRRCPEVQFFGFGGEKMAAAGCCLLYPLSRLAVMGFIPALARLPVFLKLLSEADRWLRHHRPDAIVLIDYPGLHWWLARRARFHRIPVFYFVPPQIWAWASWRVRNMRRWVDHVLCTLPFEEPWYRHRGVPAHYIGHPYFDELSQQRLDEPFLNDQRRRGGPVIGLLPGSRFQEVLHNFPTMLRAAARLRRQLPQARFLVACFRPEHQRVVAQALRGHDLALEPHVGKTPEIIHLADACIAVSGSVGLELLYRTKPAVVVYKVDSLILKLSRRYMSSKYISLVNLLAHRELLPEYLTDRCESHAIADQLLRWLREPALRAQVCQELTELRDRVGRPGACERASRYLLDTLAARPQRKAA